MKRNNNIYREQLAVSSDMPSGRVYFSDDRQTVPGYEQTLVRKPENKPVYKPSSMDGQMEMTA